MNRNVEFQAPVELSVVVPVYNESAIISLFHERLINVLAHIGYSFEVIYINDGSKDRSEALLRQIAGQGNAIRVVNLTRNFGHMMALAAGLDHAKGNAVITMDADLQHPPETLPEMVGAWKDGALVVNAVRANVRQKSVKSWVSHLYYRLMNQIAEVPLIADAPDFRLLDRKVVECLQQLPERKRFYRGLVAWLGFPQEQIFYTETVRCAGQTKYSVWKMVNFAIDGVGSFSAFPLRLAGIVGITIGLLGFIYLAYALYVALVNSSAVTGWTSIIGVCLIMGGAQLVFLGVLGEYIGRIFNEVKGRPLYVVGSRYGFSGDDLQTRCPQGQRVKI